MVPAAGRSQTKVVALHPRYDEVPIDQLPRNVRRRQPPAILCTAVTALNAFIDSPAFLELLVHWADELVAAERKDPRVGCIEVELYVSGRSREQLRVELLSLVKGLNITVVPDKASKQNVATAYLKSYVIKINRRVLTAMYDPAVGDTPALQALIMVKLVHELFHFVVPVFLQYLHKPRTPPHTDTPTMVQPYKDERETVRGEAGELAEVLLCGYVLVGVGKPVTRSGQPLFLVGAQAIHQPATVELGEDAVARLVIARFNAEAPVKSFKLTEDLLQPVTGSTANSTRSSKRRKMQRDARAEAGEGSKRLAVPLCARDVVGEESAPPRHDAFQQVWRPTAAQWRQMRAAMKQGHCVQNR